MTGLVDKKCVPCEGGVEPIGRIEAESLLKQLQPEWRLSDDGKSLHRDWKFKNFYHTMSFVNAVAHIANAEDHHPDLEVGYGYCRMKYSTHAIDGLCENDFICAAKVDALPRQ
ncbi:4a-hydroxytetrahydrobiopterin dehydratase [Povalibacter sp.]|uniref:4a-hydroxytetrahydrobiopterin dehydratase n=1 Tax=Povalibacter sp. TaxID=1962978 RepID=UPI002F40FD6D